MRETRRLCERVARAERGTALSAFDDDRWARDRAPMATVNGAT